MKTKHIYLVVLGLMPLMVFGENTGYKEGQLELNSFLKQAFKRDGKLIVTPAGKILLDTQKGYSNVVMARRGITGKLETMCTNNQGEAKRFFSGEGIKSITGEKHVD